jgi:intein/homing endonuclease
MNFKELSDKEKKEYADLMFQKLSSAEELKNWVMLFLGLDMPIGSVDPDSNSSPIDAMWEIYNTIRLNKGAEIPGYIMLSARECYKCQVKGSKILTQNGLINIEDVKVGNIIWSGFSWQKVTNHIYDGFKAGITVEVDGGLSFTGSPIHRYWVLRDGKEQWVKSNELNPQKDLIAINVNTGLSNDVAVNREEFDTGYFLGLLAGDGSVSAIDSLTHKHFTLTTIDPHIKDFFYKYVENRWQSKIHPTSDGIGYAVWDKKAIEDIKKLGVKAARSWEKQIPSYAFTSTSAMKGFISGLFDTDGSFDKSGHAIISITALELLQDVQKALVSFGVLSRVRSNVKKYGKQKHLIHTLTISHSELKNLAKTGISFSAKKANSNGSGKIPNTHDALPKSQVQWFLDLCDSYGHLKIRNRKFKKRSHGKYPTMSVDRLSHLCSWMEENSRLSDKVTNEDKLKVSQMRSILKNKWRTFELKNEESVEFYDLTVENDHSYWSNGSISHNTLGASILETLLMLHFELTIAHMAAIQAQSAKAVQYINYFFAKIEPLLEVAGWTKTSENKSKISFRTNNDEDVYIRVIVATMAGANCVSGHSIIDTSFGQLTAKEAYIKVSSGADLNFISYNHKSGIIEEKKAINAFMETKKLVTIELEDGTVINCSPEHKFYVDGKGYVEAQYLTDEDFLSVKKKAQ